MQFQCKLFLLLLFNSLSIFGQQLHSKNFTTVDGLPNNAVRSLFLDKESKLWIGTENGISIFKNNSFTNLNSEDGLSQNSCWDICQDSNGNMWFASYGGGVSFYNGNDFRIFTTQHGLPENKIRKVFSYKDKIYVGTEYGISIIDINSNLVFTPKEVFPNFGVFIVTDIFEQNNQIYFSTLNEGIFMVENNEKPKVIPVIKHKNVYSIGVFGNNIFISNKGYVDNLNLKSNTTSKSFKSSVFWEYAQDNKHKIYAAGWGIYDNSGGLFEIINNQAVNISEQLGIDSRSLLNVVFDKNHNILYAGSKDKGFYQVFLNKAISFNSFDNKKIVDFEDDVILHKDGLAFNNLEVKNNLKSSEFKFFQKKYISKNKLTLPDHARGFFELDYTISAPDIEFYRIVKRNQSYWINSNIGIFEVSYRGKIVNYIPIHTYQFGFTNENLFFESNPYGGIHLYDDISKLTVRAFSTLPTDIVATLNANKKTYFLSVFKGLFSYDGNQFSSYLKDEIWNEEKLKFITRNDLGQLIIASEFGNVFIIDDSKSFKVLKKIPIERIFGNSINFVECYDDALLIGTEKGLTIYENNTFRFIDKEQGLADCNFTTSEVMDGKLFLGTNIGYYTVDLQQLLMQQKSVSELKISSVYVNNVRVNTNFRWGYYTSSDIVTNYDKNSFSIDFEPSGHLFPNKLRYRYRLKNTNTWSPYSEKPNVFLSYLPHGDYTLEVDVLDLNAGTSKVFNLLKIKIETPFWFTWWFNALLVLIFVGGISTILLRAKKQSKRKALIEKRIAETKLEALLSQMNPHFTFNAMNAIQSFIITNDKLNSLHFIGEFAKLMRKTLDNSSRPSITVEEELDYLKTYITLENMRFSNRVNVEYLVSNEVDLLTPFPTMLLQPFVENVFVHAFSSLHPNPRLIISFEMEQNSILLCKIMDNGKGISTPKSTLHQSKGILLAKERLELLDTKVENVISIENASEGGTVVSIRITLDYSF